MRRTLLGNPITVTLAALAGALAVLASWKAPGSPLIVEVSALSSGIGWLLLVSLSVLLLAFLLGRSKDASGAVWRRRHAALHIRVFWSLSRALAFLLGAAAVLVIALLLGHGSAAKPAALLLLEFAWYLWCIHQMAEPLRVEGHTLAERE
jgi:Ca2+/Na+ antiporter